MEAQPWKLVLQCYLSDVIRQFANKGAEHEFQKEKDTENYIVDHHSYSGAGDDCSYIAVVFISGIERNFKMNRMKTGGGVSGLAGYKDARKGLAQSFDFRGVRKSTA